MKFDVERDLEPRPNHDLELFLPNKGMFNPILKLLSPLKSVVPVVFTPNTGLLNSKCPPNYPVESTNKPAEKSEFLLPDWGPGRFLWVGPKLRNGLKGGYLVDSGSFESARSDVIVRLLIWDTEVTTNADKTSSNPVFS